MIKVTAAERIEPVYKAVDLLASDHEVYTNIQVFNREEGFRMLMSGRLAIPECEALLDKLGYYYSPFREYCAACILIDGMKNTGPKRRMARGITQYEILNILKGHFEQADRFELAFINEDEIMVLFQPSDEVGAEGCLQSTLDQINQILKKRFNITVSMGVVAARVKRIEIPGCYQQARELAQLRFFGGPGSCHEEGDGPQMPFIRKRSTARVLQEAVLRQDGRTVQILVNEWFEELRQVRESGRIGSIRSFVMETWLCLSGGIFSQDADTIEYQEPYPITEFLTAETIDELKNHFMKAVRMAMKYLRQKKSTSPEIARLLKYLEAHVEENISLTWAAEQCALGKSQFCLLFKKHTGETFVNYFNRLKLEKAFSLLSSENIRVQEAAGRVGIEDISYFSRLFKKHYQISPSEVRKV